MSSPKLRKALKEGRSMSGEEIAKVLGTTRQNVSNTLKRAMEKFYDGVKIMHPELSPFQAAQEMIKMLQVDSEDVDNFYNLFPPKVRDEIKDDAKKFLRGKPIRAKEEDDDF